MNICVLGLGYIGLPTASILATNGINVFGYDISSNVIEVINSGNSHVEEPGLKTLVQAAVNSGKLKAFTSPQVADVYIIAVPTPINEEKKADLSAIKAATETLLPILKKGDLIILESTSPPGTTRDVLVPILEKTGLQIGMEVMVAYCPERVLPGKIIQELINNPRIIGGINKESAQAAQKVYKVFVEGDIHLTDATTAEMVKLMENTYRDVNIALANELAKIASDLKVNAWEIIKLANLHPRVNIHSPGPGVGGHCISVDPWFIVEKFPHLAKLIHQSRQINDSMPEYVFELICDKVSHIKNPKITVLGVTYKANIDDCREAPSEHIIHLLKTQSNFHVCIYDPHVKYYDYELSSFEDAFKDSDCIVLAVDHTEYKFIDPEELSRIVRSKIIIDTRNALDKEKVERFGFQYFVLGNN